MARTEVIGAVLEPQLIVIDACSLAVYLWGDDLLMGKFAEDFFFSPNGDWPPANIPALSGQEHACGQRPPAWGIRLE